MKNQNEFNCECGTNKFIIITEKMYDGYVNRQNILICEPEEQHIEIIKCSSCDKKYNIKDFDEIDY